MGGSIPSTEGEWSACGQFVKVGRGGRRGERMREAEMDSSKWMCFFVVYGEKTLSGERGEEGDDVFPVCL